MTALRILLGRPREKRVKVRPKPDYWQKIHDLAVRNERPFAKAFRETMEAAAGSMSVEQMTGYLELDRPELAIQVFNRDLVDAAYGQKLYTLVQTLMRKAAKLALPTVTGFQKADPTEEELVIRALLDLNNPEAIRAASILGASEVTAITLATQRALREIVTQAQTTGLSVPEQARRIAQELKKGVGLTAPQVKTLARLTAEWETAGVADLAGLKERMRKQMIRQRSLVIARNETMEAANAGVNSLWNAAMDEGYLPTTVEREWVTQPGLNAMNPCPICRPMDGQRRQMGEPFRSPYNNATALRAPIHVQCMCVLVLGNPTA